MKPLIEFVNDYSLGRYYPNNNDLREIGDFTRENILNWMNSHTGVDWVDIVPVVDFHAVCGDVDIPWATEEAKKLWDNSNLSRMRG